MRIKIKDMSVGQIYLNPRKDTYLEYLGDLQAKVVLTTDEFFKLGKIIQYYPSEQNDIRQTLTQLEFMTLKAKLL